MNLLRKSYLFAASFMIVFAQQGVAEHWPNEVVSVTYGDGAGFGQEYFPENILGPPDSNATPQSPSSDPAQILTLGTGGEIILLFPDGIFNGPGPDLTVFENPFLFGNPPRSYTETGVVSVSMDGALWVEFPFDPETLEGLAGVTPTNGSADPLDPEVSGGDSFDLTEIGLDSIYYVRIVDADQRAQDLGSSFDLDAVAAIYASPLPAGVHEGQNATPTSAMIVRAWPNPFNSHVALEFSGKIRLPVGLKMYNLCGRVVSESVAYSSIQHWSADHLPSGTYFLRAMDSDGRQVTITLQLVR